MGLIALLPEIDEHIDSAFVMHERSEKLIPLHVHKKGQLGFIEGGIAYITIDNETYVVPAHHYFWIPVGIPHTLRVGHSGTVLRSLYFYTSDEGEDDFYSILGIYPASELLIQMIKHTEKWDGQHLMRGDYNYEFMISIKKLLPQLNTNVLPIILPSTADARMTHITEYLEENLAEQISLRYLSNKFFMSERSMSRMFQSHLHISFLQYLKTLRMIKAIEMLVKTNLSITDIAFAVGYDTVGSFSNTFYTFTHSRPSDLRRK